MWIFHDRIERMMMAWIKGLEFTLSLNSEKLIKEALKKSTSGREKSLLKNNSITSLNCNKNMFPFLLSIFFLFTSSSLCIQYSITYVLKKLLQRAYRHTF